MDPSRQPFTVDGAQYWIDPLNPVTWVATIRNIRHYQPDATILQWWTSFWAPAWFVLASLHRLVVRRPLVFICHNVLPHEPRWWDPCLVRLVLGWGTLVVVQSQEQRDELLRLIPAKRVVVVPLPVFDMLSQQPIARTEARKRLSLPEDVPVLLFFGFVREYKGLKDVLLAMPEIRDRLGRVILLIAGEFWEDKKPYLELLEQMAIGDSVVIQDCYIPNEEVALYFGAADLLVAPYRTMTGSGAIQTAIGFGLPVITTEAACWPAGSHGDLVSRVGQHGLAAAVVDLLTETQRPPRSGKAGVNGTDGWDALVRCIEGECIS